MHTLPQSRRPWRARCLTALLTAVAVASSGFGALAFPEAIGHGKNATGGRAATTTSKVYLVTTRQDTIAAPYNTRDNCSLRYALEVATGPRIVVFKVGGYFDLLDRITISSGNITVAGQTAPNGGVHLRRSLTLDPSNDSCLHIDADNVILRYLTLRSGDSNLERDGADGLSINKGSNIIIDHCTIQFGSDAAMDINAYHGNIANVTIQRSIVGPGLCCPDDLEGGSPGGHNTAGVVSRRNDPPPNVLVYNINNVTYYRNLIPHCNRRMIRFANNQQTSNPPTGMQFVNNVIYDWKDRATEFSGNVSVDVINNLYRPGPWTDNNNTNGVKNEEFVFAWDDGSAVISGLSLFLSGNRAEFRHRSGGSPSNPVIVDPYAAIRDWEGVIKTGYTLRGSAASPAISWTKIIAAEDLIADLTSNANSYAAGVGNNKRLAESGLLTNLFTDNLVRDTIDQGIINDLVAREAQGQKPLDDYPDPDWKWFDTISDYSDGWPDMVSKTPHADTDKDGMGDVWETNKFGNLTKNPMDDYDGDGYKNLEEYLNGTDPKVSNP